MSEPALRVSDLGKSFGGKEVLSNVDITFGEGKLHAVVGENGAAKSTLFNIVAGTLVPTTGFVSLQGTVLRQGDVRAASNAGIGLLPQHGSLSLDMTVLENFALARHHSGKIAWRELDDEACKALGRLDVPCSTEDRVGDLPLGVAKVVELARLLWQGKKIVMLDEPTAILGPRRSASMFSTLRDLARSGTMILFSSHKVEEVIEWADEIHVLRKGRHVISTHSSGLERIRLLEAMFGEKDYTEGASEPSPIETAPQALEIRSLECESLKGKPLDLSLRAGEGVAIVGLPGNGQDEIMATLTGKSRPSSGEILICGQFRGDRSMHGWGMGRIPGDAVGQSAIESMCVDENLVLHDCFKTKFHRLAHGLLDWPSISAWADLIIKSESLAISDADCEFDWMSGGNQRKLLIARELGGSPKVVVAQNIEAGLDHVACSVLVRRLRSAMSGGAGLLMFAEEIDFLRPIVDRVFTIEDGTLTRQPN